mmetsp:Transcript_27149/g.58508  ORF Transcript_27149/g.58508 Transcript_27149/m.58508 type:complete len:129 (-) Transcript_27149:99-485(-)
MLCTISAALFSLPWLGSPSVQTCEGRILRSFPHDREAFTQGLFYDGGDVLVESTGLYGSSSVRRVRIADGVVLQKEMLQPSWFGEGVTIFGRRCFQLLWREGMGLVRDSHTFEIMSTFDLPRGVEGWG